MLLRPAEPADAMTVARVHVRSWQVGYRDLLPADCLAALKPEDRAQRYTFGNSDPRQPFTVIAIQQQQICGFATVAPANEHDASDFGLLAALYVDPDHWRRGIGRALLRDARSRLTERGFRHAVLWVLAGNTRAQRLYEQDGWKADGQQRTETLWGLILDSIRYRCEL